jgi:type IV pilus assembly protein PilN
MRITLNLATRPYSDLGPAIKRLRIAMGVWPCSPLAWAGLHALHQKAEEARARDHSLHGQIARFTAGAAGLPGTDAPARQRPVLAQAVALNQLFDEKAFSWTLAMEDLETVLPGGVQVSTLEPVRDKDGHITLHLRVVGPRDRAVELVRNLEHSKRFLLPRIVGENSEIERRTRRATGAGERLEPRELRSACRLQPDCAHRIQ